MRIYATGIQVTDRVYNPKCKFDQSDPSAGFPTDVKNLGLLKVPRIQCNRAPAAFFYEEDGATLSFEVSKGIFINSNPPVLDWGFFCCRIARYTRYPLCCLLNRTYRYDWTALSNTTRLPFRWSPPSGCPNSHLDSSAMHRRGDRRIRQTVT